MMLEDINMFTGFAVLLFISSFMAAMELSQYFELRRRRKRDPWKTR